MPFTFSVGNCQQNSNFQSGTILKRSENQYLSLCMSDLDQISYLSTMVVYEGRRFKDNVMFGQISVRTAFKQKLAGTVFEQKPAETVFEQKPVGTVF